MYTWTGGKRERTGTRQGGITQKDLSEPPEYVYWNGAPLKNVRVSFYLGNPRRNGRLIGRSIIRSISPCEHGAAEIRWKIPRNAGRLDVYAVASHETGPAGTHQILTAKRTFLP